MEQFTMPDTQAEKQEIMEKLFDDIFNKSEMDKIPLYNKIAKHYNNTAGANLVITIDNFLKQKQKIMATKTTKKEETKVASKATSKATSKVAPKATSKVSSKAKGNVPGKLTVKEIKVAKPETSAKGPSQKTRIVELAEKGFTIDEIVDKTGIKKANVQWYFSKLSLNKNK